MKEYIEGNIFIKEDVVPASGSTTYQGCDCATCKELNVDCPECPECKQEEQEEDSEIAMAMYDSSIGKADPVPNCIPVDKSDSWTNSPFRLGK